MGVMCRIFGHKMRFLTHDIAGESKCVRCGYVVPAIKWPKPEKNTVEFICNGCGNHTGIIAEKGGCRHYKDTISYTDLVGISIYNRCIHFKKKVKDGK